MLANCNSKGLTKAMAESHSETALALFNNNNTFNPAIPTGRTSFPTTKRQSRNSVMSQDHSESDDFMDYSEQESDDNYDEEDVQFEPVVSEKSVKKAYQVDFTVLDRNDITHRQNIEVNHVCGILGCTTDTASTLLRYFKWNKESLIEQYMDNEEETCKKAGVSISATPSLIYAIQGFMCPICCDDEEGLLTIGMQCDHRYCVKCYNTYLVQKIKDEGESKRIKCPGVKCHLIVDDQTVKSIVDKEVYERYQTLLIKTFVEDHQTIKWCPSPNCDYSIECKIKQSQLLEIVPTVQCKCGYAFCFGCGLPNHLPCPCEVTRLWLKKCADDSETSNWISANTKECSQCHATIEKNGGCNHMSCRKCKYEFCWVCMGPWSEHGGAYYNCNRYEEKAGVEARNAQDLSRVVLKRYLHYYDRYANHENSAKLDKDLYMKTEKKMEQVQQTSELSWIEVQFLQKAVEVLLQSRFTLKWTYAFAYYLARNNQTELFEDNQRDLEMAVEQLSGLLEQDIISSDVVALKQQVIDKSVYVSTRLDVLLEDTAKGLIDGRWAFNIEVGGRAVNPI